MFASRTRRLTLVELIVVMIVLVALAGIVIARFGNVLTQAHVAATTTNVPSLESTVRGNMLLKSGEVGSAFDSLIVTPATPAVASYMPGNTSWEPYVLQPEDIAAMQAVGLDTVVEANAQAALIDEDATFGSHTAAPAAPVAVLAMQTGGPDADMLTSFNMVPDPTSRYLAFGIGSQCTLVGGGEDAVFAEAPVHFGDTPGTRSNLAYTRYFLVFELSNAGSDGSTDPLPELRLLGAAAPHENGLERNEAHLKEFYGN